jgi:hypothetical protein
MINTDNLFMVFVFSDKCKLYLLDKNPGINLRGFMKKKLNSKEF